MSNQLDARVLNLIRSKFPITKGKFTLDITDLELKKPEALGNIQKEYELKLNGEDLQGSIRGKFVLKENDKIIDQTRKMTLVKIPYKSERGTYIINGQEKAIANQLRSKPGPYTQIKKPGLVSTQISFANYSAPRIVMEVDANKDVFVVKVANKNFPGIKFLEFIGCTDNEIRNAIGRDALAERILKNSTKGGNATLDMLFNLVVNRGFEKKKYKNKQQAITMIQEALTNNASFGPDGEEVTEINIGKKSQNFDKKTVLATVRKTFDVARGRAEEDDRDDLVFQKVMTGEDYLYNLIEQDIEKLVQGAESVMTGREKNVTYLSPALAKMNKSVKSFLTTGQLAEDVEETNPLHLVNSLNKVTMTGEGGLSDNAMRNADKQRNLKRTGINRLDPVHTPESKNIGIVNYLAQDAEIKNGTITTKFYKVQNGKAVKSDSNVVELTPKQEYESYVAFHDLRYIDNENGVLKFKTTKAPARYRGEILDSVDVSKIQYIDKAPQNLFGVAANMVPFAHHNDGNRMLMGANMQTQAINLVNREEPLVQVAKDLDKSKTYEEELGEKAFTVKSPVSGVVTKVENNKITIQDDKGKSHKVDIYDYFPLNRNNFINNEPVVNVGDKVQQGQLIAEGWQTRNGKLALGVNARVGYLPFNGYNYEDGIVVSESFANKVTTEELITEEIKVRDNHVGGPGSNAKQMLKEYTNATDDLSKLDKDGIIKQGADVAAGDILVVRLKPVNTNELTAERSLYAKLTGGGGRERYNDASDRIPKTGYTQGKVIKVETIPNPEDGVKYTIKITIAQQKSLKLGDKLAGRHGNKGTITKILPDDQMPKTEEGKPLELLFSPLAVPSRKNLGQLLEVNAGLIAEKEGKPFKVVNFDPKAKEEVERKLEEIGLPDGKIKVIDPESGKPYDNPVTVGNMYVMKLKHKVDDKIQSRSAIEGQGPNIQYLEPSKSIGEAAGEKFNPQRIGQMEMWALQAHKAVNNILEATTLKGDGAGDKEQRLNIFEALSGKRKLHDLSKYNGTPESLNILNNSLAAMGLKMTPINNGKRVKSLNDTYSEMMLTPMKDDDILKLVGEDNEVVSARKYKAKIGEGDEAEVGGLFDPNIFGKDDSGEDRNKWGYIKLTHPVPNPLFMADNQYNLYAELTPFNTNDLKKIMEQNVVVITEPGESGFKVGEIVKTSQIEALEAEGMLIGYKAGGEAILHFLKKVDIDKELTKTKDDLMKAKGKKREKLYRRYRALESLKKNDLKPEDLMVNIIPVVPKYMRPRIQQGKDVITDDLNKLYGEILLLNSKFKNTLGKPEYAAPHQLGKDSSSLYKAITNLYGVTTMKDRSTGRDVKGFKDYLGGKEGLVKYRMLAKKVDYSGRAVIGVDPDLKLDEVGLPIDMAKNLYKPFLIKRMVKRGIAKNEDQAENMLKSKVIKPEVKKEIQKLVEERPLIINRAPSLHKFSMQAFKPKITDYDDTGQPIRTLQLNPLVVTGFNADFDGDQMAVHVPLTDKSVKEAKELMMPSKNFINPRDGGMIIQIRHEMLLGIYYLTMNADKPKGQNKTFGSYAELKEAWKKKEVDVRQKATLDGYTSTVGMLLFAMLIPKKYSKYRQDIISNNKTMAKGEINALLRAMYDDDKVSITDLSNLIDDIKKLGFEAATKSGLSIGIKDFKKPKDMDKRLDEVIKSIDKDVENDEGKLVAGVRDIQEAIRDFEAQIEKEYKSGKILDPDNPVQIMMQSGSRGNAGQIRRMSGLVGSGVDVLGNPTSPVFTSHLEGLSPQDYWKHSYDSRKGMYDRVVSTQEPGALTKKIMSGNQDIIVTEKDCKTTDGININKRNKTIIGRFVPKDIVDKNGVVLVKAGSMITKNDFDNIAKADNITEIIVRSPMTCKAQRGVCQKCYGAMPGTKQLPEIGEPIGILATQAFGEPVTQMTMNTFHSGGSNSSATLGLPRIEEIIGAKKTPANQAVLAEESGAVTIKEENGQKVVYVGKRRHVIGVGPDGKPKPLRVKDGDYVNKGDFLTVGAVSDMFDERFGKVPMTSANPEKLLSLNKDYGKTEALRRTQDYLANSMEYAFAKTMNNKPGEALDRRHIELTVGQLTSKVTVLDPGDSPYMPGQVINKAEADRWNERNSGSFNIKTISTTNADKLVGRISAKTYKDKRGIIVREGEKITKEQAGRLYLGGLKEAKVKPKPIEYDVSVQSLGRTVTQGHDNWMSNLGYENLRHQLARGAALGQVDKMDSIRSRQMTGKMLNIGKGYELWDKAKDVANSFTNSLVNMFT